MHTVHKQRLRRLRRKFPFSFPPPVYLLLLLPFLFLARYIPTSSNSNPPELTKSEKILLPPVPPQPAVEALPLSEAHPRYSRVTIRANRTHGAGPSLHAFLLCRGCCRSLAAIQHQTLVPPLLTVVHRCANAAGMRESLRNALSMSDQSSFVLRPRLILKYCHEDISKCTLQYLAETSQLSRHLWTVVLDDGLVLEPVALEKMWLSATTRLHVVAVTARAYVAESLQEANRTADPLVARQVTADEHPVQPLPLLFNVTAYRDAVDATLVLGDEPWEPFIRIIAKTRVIKESLFTRSIDADVLSLEQVFTRNATDVLPAHLFTQVAFHSWSSRMDDVEMFANDLDSPSTGDDSLDLSSIRHWPVEQRREKHRIMILMPGMQMGGSEKCMLDIANKLVDLGWDISFVFTMSFWQEDSYGEVSLVHQWIDLALHLTSDVFDILALSSIDKSPRIMRYLLESRRPDFVMVANTRWAYLHSRFIKAVVPRAIMADYNHMIHMGWDGGGLPRFGANNSMYYDLHLTASRDVASHMKRWIDPHVLARDSLKVRPCHIGTNTSVFYAGSERAEVRKRFRDKLGIPESTTLVLFAGRFVIDKGIDIVGEVVRQIEKDTWLANKVSFVFVGSGKELSMLEALPTRRPDGKPLVTIHPPADGLEHMRDYYAAADVFLLPSINEGIALVLYEAMAAGVLVITTDVGGQREIVTERTGILLPSSRYYWEMTNVTFDKLKEVVDEPEAFTSMTEAARDMVFAQYTTEKFLNCVVNNLVRVDRLKFQIPDKKLPLALGLKPGIDDMNLDDLLKGDADSEDILINETDTDTGKKASMTDLNSSNSIDDNGETNVSDDSIESGSLDSLFLGYDNPLERTDSLIDRFKPEVVNAVSTERYHGEWNRNAVSRTVEGFLTIGIKTYACDDSTKEQVVTLLRSIREYYPKVRVILGNDGPHSLAIDPHIRNDNYTEEHMLMRDSGISYGRNYMVNQTRTKYFLLLDDDHRFDDSTNLTVLINGIENDDYDIVGMRVRNLPGIDELERTNIVIPRYVAIIRRFEERQLTLCVWNENRGPSVYGIQHPIPVDVLHNAFIGRVDSLREHPWRNELKVNEHMTFFLDAKDAGLRVGYLPSVFVHHRSRDYSDCYYSVRFREDRYRRLLRYKDLFMWDMDCQFDFPDRVRQHILKNELDI